MTKPLKLFWCLGIVWSVASVVHADLAAPPTPYVVSSANGSFYFKMIPDKKDVWNKAKSKGILYEVRSGKDKVVYTVSGWYSYQVFISNNGKYLMRMGDWPSGSPKAQDLAIAFYVDGEEKKRYSTLDLLKEPNKAPRSISHYTWLDMVDASYITSQMFLVKTVEKAEITFDITSGEIKFTELSRPSASK
jgi:hypothetical protein